MIQIDWNAVADIVLVDFVNNMLITIGWITALNRSEDSNSPSVFTEQQIILIEYSNVLLVGE